ncbi:hypothetical protein B9G55_18800 [Saccharibacillus sp. O16]|nr:hypothetical protein B9G55_18800 [Saccharibacillus sp. O16]
MSSSRMNSAQQQAKSPVTFTATELMTHAEQLFGVREEVLHGALGQGTEKQYTVEQAASRITQFMKAKVK